MHKDKGLLTKYHILVFKIQYSEGSGYRNSNWMLKQNKDF